MNRFIFETSNLEIPFRSSPLDPSVGPDRLPDALNPLYEVVSFTNRARPSSAHPGLGIPPVHRVHERALLPPTAEQSS